MILSAVIIAKNAESTIERTLLSVGFAHEVVVIVDAATSDNTASIARRLGAHVHVQEWQGYGAQKNSALTKIRGDWVLFVDDDEVVSPDLAREVLDVTERGEKDFYWLRIITVFLGKPLRHLVGHNLRLFRKDVGRWSDARVHEQIEHEGSPIVLGDDRSAVLTHPLVHYSHDSIRSYLAKMHRYTTLDAEEMARRGKHRSGRAVRSSMFLPYTLALRALLKLLFYRGGVFDGWQGWVWCVLSAYYEWEMARKFNAKV